MKTFLSIISSPLTLCFGLSVSIGLIVNAIVKEASPWFLLIILGVPLGLGLSYLLRKIKTKK